MNISNCKLIVFNVRNIFENDLNWWLYKSVILIIMFYKVKLIAFVNDL